MDTVCFLKLSIITLKKKYTEIQLIHNIILVSDILHSDLVFTHINEIISTISLETMHPHIKLLQSY